jgi:hypothetical protein
MRERETLTEAHPTNGPDDVSTSLSQCKPALANNYERPYQIPWATYRTRAREGNLDCSIQLS